MTKRKAKKLHKYQVLVTRPASETTYIDVLAENDVDASDKALAKARDSFGLMEWTLDSTTSRHGDFDVTGVFPVAKRKR